MILSLSTEAVDSKLLISIDSKLLADKGPDTLVAEPSVIVVPLSVILESNNCLCTPALGITLLDKLTSLPLLPVGAVNKNEDCPPSSTNIQLSFNPSHSIDAVALVEPLSYTCNPAYRTAGVSALTTTNASPIILAASTSFIPTCSVYLLFHYKELHQHSLRVMQMLLNLLIKKNLLLMMILHMKLIQHCLLY